MNFTDRLSMYLGFRGCDTCVNGQSIFFDRCRHGEPVDNASDILYSIMMVFVVMSMLRVMTVFAVSVVMNMLRVMVVSAVAVVMNMLRVMTVFAVAVLPGVSVSVLPDAVLFLSVYQDMRTRSADAALFAVLK